jgi:hypothetical protein
MTNETPKEPLHELTLGRVRPSPDPTRPASPSPSEDDGLEAVVARCRAKAEAARGAAERQRLIRERYDSPDDDAQSDPATAEWAQALTDAFYWLSAEATSEAPDVALLDDVGGCFETVAEGLLLFQKVQSRQGGLDKALPLLAEAQSALRQSLRRLKAREDPDQIEVYERVRNAAARHRLFLKRFLRADDPADPAAWPDLLARIEARTGADPRTQRQAMLLDRLHSLCATTEGERDDDAWRSIFDVLDELINEGAPPSSREIRELLVPLVDELPEAEDLPPGCRLVLREIDRFLATRPKPEAPATPEEPTKSIREAARLLSGRSAVLIGGLRRPQAQRSLQSALGLKELVWLGTKEHQSTSAFEPAIARPDVAVVLLAIRWSSHGFTEVKPYCDHLGKPLVRLPGGYGANQVAAQVLAQCGERLARIIQGASNGGASGGI